MNQWRLGRVVTAWYHSPCSQCDQGLKPGQRIRANGEGGWMHSSHTPTWIRFLPVVAVGLCILLGFLCVGLNA